MNLHLASAPTQTIRHFWTFSAENRMLFGAVAFLSIAFLLAGILFFRSFESHLTSQYDHLGRMVASVVSVEGEARMVSGSRLTTNLKRLTDSILSTSDDVVAIEFYDPQGKLLFENHRSLPGDQLENVLDFSAPVRTPEVAQPLGQVHVKLTGQTLTTLAGSVRNLLIAVFFGAWLLAVLAVLSNSYVWSKHIKTLVRGVKRLSSGEFGFRLNDRDLWGELRVLAQAFNDMSLRLRAYEDQNIDSLTFERNKMEAVLLSIADGVIVCDEQGEVVIANEPAARMLDAPSAQTFLGQTIQDYLALDGTHPFAAVLEGFNAHQKRQPVSGPAYASTPSWQLGEPYSHQLDMPSITLKVLVSPIQDSAYNRLGLVMILHDITREHEVDQLKTHFISNVSHELRTPVTTIKSYVDTLYNHGADLDEETYDEFVETIHLETDRLKKLVNDILDFSRLEQGSVALEMEWQDIAPIVNLTVQSVRVLAEQKALTVTTSIESQLPKVYMNADSIERVLRNLLSNAIKYTPEQGRIKIRAEVSDNGEWVEVTVTDNGIGIPEEHLPHIFDRFYRVENKVHTVKGTGLGLHLVKIAVETHHQGEVFVVSRPGEGSTFGFRLPIFLDEESVADNR